MASLRALGTDRVVWRFGDTPRKPPWPCSHATVVGHLLVPRSRQDGAVRRPQHSGGSRGRSAGVAGAAGERGRRGRVGRLGAVRVRVLGLLGRVGSFGPSGFCVLVFFP